MEDKHNTIVLDVDETLIHATEEGKNVLTGILEDPKMVDVRKDVLTINFGDRDWEQMSDDMMWATKRPHLDEFIDFCFHNFDIVVVWSAGEYDYVHKAVRSIFLNHQKPHHILTRNDCVKRPHSHKPLKKLYDIDPRIKSELTLIVDDLEENFIKNSRNGIIIPEYRPELDQIRLYDDNLLKFMDWALSNLAGVADYRPVDKSNIF